MIRYIPYSLYQNVDPSLLAIFAGDEKYVVNGEPVTGTVTNYTGRKQVKAEYAHGLLHGLQITEDASDNSIKVDFYLFGVQHGYSFTIGDGNRFVFWDAGEIVQYYLQGNDRASYNLTTVSQGQKLRVRENEYEEWVDQRNYFLDAGLYNLRNYFQEHVTAIEIGNKYHQDVKLPTTLTTVGIAVNYDHRSGVFDVSAAKFNARFPEGFDLRTMRKIGQGPHMDDLHAVYEMNVILELLGKQYFAGCDLIYINRHGRTHPNKCGVATCLGGLLNIAVIGCSNFPMTCEAAKVSLPVGGNIPIKCDDETVGFWVKTCSGKPPYILSCGFGISAKEVLHNFWQSIKAGDVPEPLSNVMKHRGGYVDANQAYLINDEE